MNFPSMRPRRPPRLSLGVAGALVLATASHAPACGPFFPNTYLNASDAELLAAPEGSFAGEIARLLALAPPVLPPWKVVQPKPGTYWNSDAKALQETRDAVLAAEFADLDRAMAARGDPPDPTRTIADSYREARQQLETWARRHRDQVASSAQAARYRAAGMNDLSVTIDPPVAIQLPAGLPVEFAEYFAGAKAWYEDRKADARAAWTAVLALPEAERRHRSVSAAFMLGRVWTEEAGVYASLNEKGARADAEAVRYARQVRSLVGAGLADPLGLAAASLGWEAKAELLRGNYDRALNLYLTLHAMGDSTALESLRRAAGETNQRATPENLLALARDPTSRGVLTAYWVARGGEHGGALGFAQTPGAAGRLAAAMQQAGVQDQPNADRLAWLAYEGGQFVLAQQWAALAPAKSAIAEWIRAQLALRAGNLPEGEKRLRSALAAGGLSEPQQQRAWAELGRTCLAQDHAADALTAWLAGGHDRDALYVANRVLTIAELRTFVDAHRDSALERTLAQRLARDGQVDAAQNYFTGEDLLQFQGYVQDVRLAFDSAKLSAERAEAFWRAAQAMQRHGMDFLGTELETDYYSDRPKVLPHERLTDADEVQARRESRLAGGVFAPTPDELKRLGTAQTAPEKKFLHYRYRAADLAWWAAALLPNDSDETAQILDTAGRWLAARDPEAANRFYQALVIRCGNTALGRAAAARHWFPVKPAVP